MKAGKKEDRNDGITRYTAAPKHIHKKNMESFYVAKQWFTNVYPQLDHKDFDLYDGTTRCNICSAAFHPDNQRCADVSDDGKTLHGVVCSKCKEVMSNLHDCEHLIQIKEYLKGKRC